MGNRLQPFAPTAAASAVFTRDGGDWLSASHSKKRFAVVLTMGSISPYHQRNIPSGSTDNQFPTRNSLTFQTPYMALLAV